MSRTKEHPAIRQLAILSYGNHRFMLALKAYCDESGHSNDPSENVVAIGGCVAPLEAWERFEVSWKNVLEEFGVSALHMRHFAHFRGDFEGWQDDEARRQRFLQALMKVMCRDVTAYVGAAVSLPDFRSLPIEAQGKLGDPYFVCFQMCARDAAIQTLEDPAEKVEMIFAEHPQFGGRAYDLYRRCQQEMELGERLGAISFASYRDVVQLQAADLVAFELRRFVRDKIPLQPDPNPNRWPMRQILEHSPHRTFFHIFYREALELRLPRNE